MIDPFTAIAAATAAFNGIKKGIEVGKDLASMGSQLQNWSKAISDLDFAHEKASKPPAYKMFSNTQSQALEAWTAKQKANELRKELKDHISFVYGPSAWSDLVKIEGQMRKEQKEAVYRKQEAIDTAINWVVGIIIFALSAGLISIVIYFVGKSQGRW
tara:strand:- start:3192 stop:3665 length:474 start_codon:yes stop_codon:yes gene_type:complete